MDIHEARAILLNPHATTLHESAAASSYLSSYYAHEGKHLTRPALQKDAAGKIVFTDAPPGARGQYEESLATGRGERTEMGANPSSKVGPRRILKLDGPASAYQIVSSADGETWLCFSGKIDGAEDPGRPVTGNRFISDARERVAREQATNRKYAAVVSDFWKKQSGHA